MLASLLAGFPRLTKPETGRPLATEAEVNKALIRRAAFILPHPWEATMFERGLNLRKLIPTALKTSGGRSLIYLCLAVLALSYGISRLTPSTPVSETPLARGTASTITTTLSSRRGGLLLDRRIVLRQASWGRPHLGRRPGQRLGVVVIVSHQSKCVHHRVVPRQRLAKNRARKRPANKRKRIGHDSVSAGAKKTKICKSSLML